MNLQNRLRHQGFCGNGSPSGKNICARPANHTGPCAWGPETVGANPNASQWQGTMVFK